MFLDNVLESMFPSLRNTNGTIKTTNPNSTVGTKIIYDKPIMEDVIYNFFHKIFPSLFPSSEQITMTKEVETQALNMAAANLRQHEGMRPDVYIDSRGILTVGIGHKVTASDRLAQGQVISQAQINAFFTSDITPAFNAAKAQAKELGHFEPAFIAGLTEVNFQLGTGWRSKFANTWNQLKSGNWQQAISNLQQSAWYDQTPDRVQAFIDVIQNTYA